MTILLRFPKPLARPLLQHRKSISSQSTSLCIHGNFNFKYHAHTYTTKSIAVPKEPKEALESTHSPFSQAHGGAATTLVPEVSAVQSTTTSQAPPISPTQAISQTPPKFICTPPPNTHPEAIIHLPPERVKDLKGLINAYLSLSKFRLSALIVVTTMAGYVLAPVPFHFSTFLFASVGTSLASGSANTFNQIYEVAHDAKMARTQKRILPSGKVSLNHAIVFGAVTGLAGPLILLYGVNAFAASLAFANIFLYAGVYTPLKRVHPINTWVGSIVGAIPPVIGWVAATNSMDMGAWVLGALLFIWQIPHFLALSWGYKNDYANAGYKMLSNVYPKKLPKFCLRYCIYLLPIGALSWYSGMTTMPFAFDSLLIDAYVLWFGYQFYKESSTVKARKLFFATLIFLPVFLGMMILHSTKFWSQKQVEVEVANNKA
eukprot:Phypoly_transcript_09185.p1 GENE.Phypoly_transcript_09185~~Phypoly_transcript_09185.p1  ORF type:complete len:473 (+),score=62.22 Phypoly_transcript_09185:128-1420(+)